MPGASHYVEAREERRDKAFESRRGLDVLDFSALAVCLIGFGANAAAVADFVFEDSYITFRYAQTLASGGGFAFNAGEPVFGTTTPLWTLLLAACHLLGFEAARAGTLLFSAFLAVSALAGYVRLRLEGARFAGFVFALCTVWGTGAVLRLAGMETPLLVSLMLCASIAARLERRALSGVLLGLALFVRYDAVLFAAALLAVEWWRGRPPWRAIATGSLVFAPWLLFAQFTFGSVLPNTLGAKAGDAQVLEYLYESVAQRVVLLTSPLTNLLGGPVPALITALVALALVAGISAAFGGLWRQRSALLAMPLYAVLIWLGYGLIAPPLAHGWYLVPASSLMLLFSLYCWSRLVTARVAGEPWAAAVVCVVLVLATLVALPRVARREIDKLTGSDLYRDRVLAYRTFAEWINERGLNDLTVMMREPGYFGYLTGSRVVDAAGLVTEDVRFHGPSAERDSFESLLERFEPDVVVANGGSKSPVPGYVLVRESSALRTLNMRRDVYEARWTPAVGEPDGLSRPGLPLTLDALGDWPGSPFRLLGEEKVLRSDGRFLRQPVLTTGPQPEIQAQIVTPSFLVEDDELLVHAGTSSSAVDVELLVDGVSRRRLESRDRLPAEMAVVRWPLAAFRGRPAQVRLRDRSPRGHGSLVSVARGSYASSRVVDDFETGVEDRVVVGKKRGVVSAVEDSPPVDWQRFNWPPRTDAVALARATRPGVVVGKGTEASFGATGRARLFSPPFEIDHGWLSFVFLDFSPRGRVELLHRGQVVRTHEAAEEGPTTVTWNVAPYVGDTVRLRVADDAEGPKRWLGLDQLTLFDRAAPALREGRLDLLDALPTARFEPDAVERALLRRRRLLGPGAVWRPELHRPDDDARRNALAFFLDRTEDGRCRSQVVQWLQVDLEASAVLEAVAGLDARAGAPSQGARLAVRWLGEDVGEVELPVGSQAARGVELSVPLAASGRGTLEIEVIPLGACTLTHAFLRDPQIRSGAPRNSAVRASTGPGEGTGSVDGR